MKKISLNEAREHLKNTDLSALPGMNLAVLRNITLEAMEPYLRYMACLMGYQLKIRWGGFDMIMQDAVGGNPELLNEQTDGVLIFSHLDQLSPDVSKNFAGLSAEKIQNERLRLQEYMQSVLAGIRRQTNGMILWHGLEIPTEPDLGIYDHQIEAGQTSFIARVNDDLRILLRQTPNAYFVDMNLSLARLGVTRFYDPRYWHIGRAPYTDEANFEIARTDFQFLRTLKGKNKKCLVLDCDNVLWGGIIGEDGLSGIKLSRNYPGSPYYEFQQAVVNLYHRGVIIALCSKNNEEEVKEVFANHPDMVLKPEHIAVSRVNWQDKASNIRSIAEELNIGLDSMVFMDDSDFEVNLVRQALPEVEVIHLPPAKAVENRRALAACGFFENLAVSAEDKMRTEMYRAESERTRLKASVTDMEEYYRSLGMELEIRFADDFSIPRIAQLTQKTNQFNLTTERYSEAQIKSFCESEETDVLSIKVKDRFGDSGLVGVCILKYTADHTAIVDSFLLSCRVLGRGVEDAFLLQALQRAKSRGSRMVKGLYIPTRKNVQTKDFYIKQEFLPHEENSNAGVQVFILDLNRPVRKEPAFFTEIISDITDNEEVLL
ncbi:MAG: HAD-IIIC family phosphatase [Candidatus Omnitrophota bacterium]